MGLNSAIPAGLTDLPPFTLIKCRMQGKTCLKCTGRVRAIAHPLPVTFGSPQALGWHHLSKGTYLKWIWWQQADPFVKSDLHCSKAHWSSVLWKSNKTFNLNYLFKMLNRVETSQVVWSFHFFPGLCLWLHRYCSNALGKDWINYSILFFMMECRKVENRLGITIFPVPKLGPLVFRGRMLSIS